MSAARRFKSRMATGCVHIAAPAGIFTAVRADAPQHTGKRQVFHNDLEGFFVLALLDHLDITLDIQTTRTSQPARGLVCLLNGKRSGNGLGVSFEGGFFGRQTFIVFTRKIYRADLGALAAAGAFGKIDIARLLANLGLKMSRFAFKF